VNILTLIAARSEETFYTVPSNIAHDTPNKQQTSRYAIFLVKNPSPSSVFYNIFNAPNTQQ
jgi:cytochrome c-type biogenesis protein CcmE